VRDLSQIHDSLAERVEIVDRRLATKMARDELRYNDEGVAYQVLNKYQQVAVEQLNVLLMDQGHPPVDLSGGDFQHFGEPSEMEMGGEIPGAQQGGRPPYAAEPNLEELKEYSKIPVESVVYGPNDHQNNGMGIPGGNPGGVGAEEPQNPPPPVIILGPALNPGGGAAEMGVLVQPEPRPNPVGRAEGNSETVAVAVAGATGAGAVWGLGNPDRGGFGRWLLRFNLFTLGPERLPAVDLPLVGPVEPSPLPPTAEEGAMALVTVPVQRDPGEAFFRRLLR